MKLQEINNTTIKETDRLSKIIFFNFSYLKNEDGIDFSIDSIKRVLKSITMVGYFLLNDDDSICGYLIADLRTLPDGRFVLYISYLYIIEKYRQKGLGTKMILKIFEYAKNNNVPYIMLVTNINKPSFNFYKKFGFKQDPIIKINNNNYYVLSIVL